MPEQVHTLMINAGLSSADRTDLEGRGINILVFEDEKNAEA
jgi:hypothetical protein